MSIQYHSANSDPFCKYSRTEKSLTPLNEAGDGNEGGETGGGEVEISGDASAGKGQMSVLDALKGVLKIALMHDGLARGLREASKALDRRQAHMCVLNEACEEEAYKKLVVALCSEHKIPLIKVPDGKELGSGLDCVSGPLLHPKRLIL